MVINQRCIDILSLLNETNELTLKKLSENFNVHMRTIRYDIENLNYILKSYKFSQIKKYERGILSLKLNSSQLNLIINDFTRPSLDYRKSYLKLKLFSKEIVTLNKEAELLSISRTTLKKDLNKIKQEFYLKNIEIEEIPSKGLKLMGEEEKILEDFENELYEVLKKDFMNLPAILKDTIGKIVGDIEPKILKMKIKEQLKVELNLSEYNKIFCKLAAYNTRRKIKKGIVGYDIEYMKNFINSIKGSEMISKSVKPNTKNEETLKEKEILKKMIKDLELEQDLYSEDFFENIKELSTENFISEKVCKTNFYKYFEKELKNSNLNKNDFQSIFYVIYNKMLLKKYDVLKNLNVLYVCDDTEIVQNIIIGKLKSIFKFKEIDVISSNIFEIFGYDKEYDLIITNKNINDMLEIPIFKMERYPLESSFADLKFLLLKKYL